MRSSLPRLPLIVILALTACAERDDPGATAAAQGEQATAQQRGSGQPVNAGPVVHLGSRFGGGGGVFCEGSWKDESTGSMVKRKFKVEVEDAPPGSRFPVTLDGVPLGELIVGLEGEGKLEYRDGFFPEAFPQPKIGSVVTVGDALSGDFRTLEKLVDLAVEFGDGTSLTGEASYQVHRWGGVVERIFELELEDAAPGAEYVITSDGREFARVTCDEDGEGEIVIAEKRGDRFPEEFTGLYAGSVIHIGDVSVTLTEKE